MTYRKRIACDFDGCLHQNVSPWSGTLAVLDPPTPGAFEWLLQALERFDVIIHTCRLAFDRSEDFHEDSPGYMRVQALRDWFLLHGFPREALDRLQWHDGRGKPHAHVYIDDRGFEFCGHWPGLDQLEAFVPWNKVDPALVAQADAMAEEFLAFPAQSRPIVDQPPPTPNTHPAVWPMVIADMQERDQVGRERYGTPLQPHNGRDALVDAYQEALDLAVYMRQAIYERDNPEEKQDSSLDAAPCLNCGARRDAAPLRDGGGVCGTCGNGDGWDWTP